VNRFFKILLFEIIIANISFAQSYGEYQATRFLYSEGNFYRSGVKWNKSQIKKEESANYELGYKFNFFISKYSLNGKKKWEIVIDEKGDVKSVSELFVKNRYIFLLLEIEKKKVSSQSYYTHSLIKIDTAGFVLNETRIDDSASYSLSEVFFSNDYIYVMTFQDKLNCIKFDYSFNTIEKCNDESVPTFFYNSKVFKVNNKFVSIGPIYTAKSITNRVKGSLTNPSEPDGYAIRKFGTGNPSNVNCFYSKSFPLNEVFRQAFHEKDRIYISTYNNLEQIPKIYIYQEKINSLKLITDSMKFGISYAKLIDSDGLLIVRGAKRIIDSGVIGNRFYPPVVYYLKKNKLQSYAEFGEWDSNYGAYFFQLIGKKLYACRTSFYDNSMKVQVYDYVSGNFVIE
jgi:hypothetical protein